METAVALVDRPRTGQRMVVDGDLVVEDVAVRLVEGDALLDDRLVVLVQRNAARLVGARPLEIAGFDFEGIETAVAVGIEPFADGIAHVAGFGRLRKIAPVRVDAAGHEDLEMHIGDVRQDDEFDRPGDRHHPRHAVGAAGHEVVAALSAGGLVGEARLQNGLILRRQRRLLPATGRLGLIPLESDPARPPPLPRPVRIFGLVECGGAGDRHHQRCDECDRTQEISGEHERLR